MKEIIQRFCGYIDDKPILRNGLLLIDLPTGIGKTNAVFDFIVENYEQFNDSKKKIFFVTTLKKNLQLDKLKMKFIEKHGEGIGESVFESNVLFIDGNWEAIYTVLSGSEGSSIVRAMREAGIDKSLIENLAKNVKTISDYELFSKKSTSHSGDDTQRDDDTTFESFAHTAKEELRNKYEPQLRKELERLVRYKENGQANTPREITKLYNGKFNFVKQLYPSSRTEQCPVLFMSLDKFLSRNCPIIQHSYQFIHSKLIENSVIFIDEFDACKDTILNNIIQQSLRTRLNLIQMFRIIYDGLHHSDFTERLCEQSDANMRKKQDRKERWYTPREIIENLRDMAKKIYDDFSFKYIFKKELEAKEVNFIFHDIKYHYILSGGAAEVIATPTQKEHINLIKFLMHDKDKDYNRDQPELVPGDSFHLSILINRLRSFISYFQNGVGYLADNYLEKKREESSVVDYTIEWAVKTVLSEFHIEGTYNNYLHDNVLLAKRQANSSFIRTSRLSDDENSDCNSNSVDINETFYEKGFQYYDFVDSEEHDTSTKINYLAYYDTPEKLLIAMASKAKVVGISATASLPTVTGNFDIRYLRQKLSNLFIEPTEDEQKRLDELFKSKIWGYDDIDIFIESVSAEQEKKVCEKAGIKFLNKFFSSAEKAEEVFGNLIRLTSDSFELKRYLRLISVMSKFVQNQDIKSFLCLMNKKADNYTSLNYQFLHGIFNDILKENNANSYSHKFRTLWGDVHKFENKKQAIHQLLAEGKKVFVLSTYQTIGAGQNLQYAVSEEVLEKLVQINDADYEDMYKDFDAIYLDKPTNVFVRINNDRSGENLAKYLYYVGFLRQNGELDLKKADEYIKNGLKNSKYIAIPDVNSINIHYAKIILQAVGRICRTKNKNGKIYVYVDEEVKDILAKAHHFFEERRLNPEFRVLLNHCGKSDIQSIDEEVKRRAINNSLAVHRYIMGMLSSDWTFPNQSKWKNLREVVLKYPCVEELTSQTPSTMYIELPTLSKEYYYKQEKDFSDTEISFDKPISGGSIVSEVSCGLDRLMKYLPLKEYFASRGYATSFSASRFFIPPVVFNNIYKGALGEVAGRFMLENEVLNSGDTLSEINALEKFEKFDFEFNNIYIDFKNYSTNFFVDVTSKIADVENRLQICNGRKAVYINVLQLDDGNSYEPRTYSNKKILVVPQLLKLDNTIDRKAVKELRKFLYE